jgi:hypothetical protein
MAANLSKSMLFIINLHLMDLLKDISFANWKQVQHFQRGNALVSKLISSIYKNKICTQLFENITKNEKNNLRSKYKTSYANFKLQKTIMIFLCGLCESCVENGNNLGTHYLGYSDLKEIQRKDQHLMDVFHYSKPFETSFYSSNNSNVNLW